MKILQKLNGKVLSRNEQQEIKGGDYWCRDVSTLSGLGCTTVTTYCYDSGWHSETIRKSRCGNGPWQIDRLMHI